MGKMSARVPYKMSDANKSALVNEMKKLALEEFDKLAIASDGMALNVLHKEFGFGEARLKRFLELTYINNRKLHEMYQMQTDSEFYKIYLDHEYAIKIKDWYAEIEEKHKGDFEDERLQ